MSNAFITGNTVIDETDGERVVRNYTPSAQEQTEEIAERVDRTPITEEQRQSLDRAAESTFQPVFGDQPSDRAETFQIPGDWVSPVVRTRRKQAMRLPSVQQVTDLEQRINKVMRFEGAPKRVVTLSQKAGRAVEAAREAHTAGRHPESSRYARSQAAKDAVIQEIANTTSAVVALERAADEAKDEWFDGLVGNLDEQRANAVKALRAAAKAYDSLRGSINGAQALAIETGKWDKSWHSSTVSEADLNAPLASMRAALDFLENGDDYTTGAFLTAEYDGIPPHTMAKLKRGADVSGGGSFAEQVFIRAKSLMANDKDAQDAVAEKRLLLLTNSNPTTNALLGKRDED